MHKKVLMILLFVFCVSFCLMPKDSHGWGWKVNISTSIQTAEEIQDPAVVRDASGVLHVVWVDGWTSLNIYYSHSVDNGVTWSTPLNLTTTDYHYHPEIDVDGLNHIHIVWEDFYNGIILYRRSTNGGASFEPAVNIGPYDGSGNAPDIAADKSENPYVHIVWTTSISPQLLQYRCSTDGGASWNSARTLNSIAVDKPSVATEGSSTVHVAFATGNGGGSTVDYFRSTDRGTTWPSTPTILSGISSSTDFSTSITASSTGAVHVGFTSDAGSDPKVISSTTSGATWGSIKQISGYGIGRHPNIAVTENGLVRIVFEAATSPPRIMVATSTDNGSTWGSAGSISTAANTTAWMLFPDIATYRIGSTDNFCVVWGSDKTDPCHYYDSDVFFMRDEYTPAPHISLYPTALNFQAVQGGPNPSSQTFSITNTGGGVLNWSVSDNAAWLDESPTSGNSNYEVITVSINTTNLAPGTYNATITVSSTNADNSPQTVAVTYQIVPLRVKITDVTGAPLANKWVKVFKVANDPPIFTRTSCGQFQTDGSGLITLPGSFGVGDSVLIEMTVHIEPATKHTDVLPNRYVVYLDNGSFNVSTGGLSYTELSGSIDQPIMLAHTSIAFDMLVSVEWDAPQYYLDSLVTSLRLASYDLYDVTDGQAYIGNVRIEDNGQRWDDCDMRVHATNDLGPHVEGPGFARIHFPRAYRGGDGTIDATWQYRGEGIWWLLVGMDNFRAIVHEMGHYYFHFLEEYKEKFSCIGSICWGHDPCSENLGFMDGPPPSGSFDTEMSSEERYAEFGLPAYFTCQYGCGWSCWTDFESQFENQWSSVARTPILKPSERGLSEPNYFAGPNDNTSYTSVLNYRTPTLRTVVNYPPGPVPCTLRIIDSNGNGLKDLKVDLFKQSTPPRIIGEGKTSSEGGIEVLGANNGDIVKFQGWWLGIVYYSFEYVIGGKSTSVEDSGFVITLYPVYDPKKMLHTLDISEGQIAYIIHSGDTLSGPLGLEWWPEEGGYQEFTFSRTGNKYTAVLPDSICDGGNFVTTALDDSLHEYSIVSEYNVTCGSAQILHRMIYSRDGSCEIVIDSSNVSLEKLALLSTKYLTPCTLGVTTRQIGAVHSLSLYPNGSLAGDNWISLRYNHQEIEEPYDELDLVVYLSNPEDCHWIPIGGEIDTLHNTITAPFSGSGAYSIFASPSYIRGDVNGDGVIDIADVVYLLNYLFIAGPAPVPILDAGDANCDGVVDASDVVYLLNYLFVSGPPPGC
jgi:hypothetical protein